MTDGPTDWQTGRPILVVDRQTETTKRAKTYRQEVRTKQVQTNTGRYRKTLGQIHATTRTVEKEATNMHKLLAGKPSIT